METLTYTGTLVGCVPGEAHPRGDRRVPWQSALIDQADAAERSARAYKGHATRLRNKISNGVCPVGDCRRHFDNVQAHIEGEHPQWAVEHPEALA